MNINQGNNSVHYETLEITAENAPVIVVAHKPTELVVSTEKPQLTPLTDDLLAMSNTDYDLFMDVKSKKYYRNCSAAPHLPTIRPPSIQVYS